MSTLAAITFGAAGGFAACVIAITIGASAERIIHALLGRGA